ncbi:MAG: hypothetical protein NC215_00480 [Ruminococcus sp.]|nr:hypothetical protein [Ruminococcus sp.]MCM1391774.1 hypothetical protein [Ruminococcus sp.]
MSDEIKNLLEEEIKTEIQGLKSSQTDAKEQKEAMDKLATLHRLYVEECKMESEIEDKREKRDMDNRKIEIDDINHINEENLKRDQIKEQRRDRFVKVGIAGAELILPLIFYGVWMKRGLKFEETGSFTSATFKGLFNRFRPTKK